MCYNVRTLAFLSLSLILMLNGLAIFVSASKEFPPGIGARVIPAPTFDPDAPECSAREACGFYSFTLKNRALRWIKSWCKCSEEQQCVYDRTDLKMRVYRQACISKDEIAPEMGEIGQIGHETEQLEEQIAKEQNHLLASARARRALALLHSLY
ncbi:hypothetical protein M3Y97_00352000 [Aphelenchoides bicaudatus]|nr:hypothetical protein M3Y97_00352000 [Aphelenchoides bicaudatus]